MGSGFGAGLSAPVSGFPGIGDFGSRGAQGSTGAGAPPAGPPPPPPRDPLDFNDGSFTLGQNLGKLPPVPNVNTVY